MPELKEKQKYVSASLNTNGTINLTLDKEQLAVLIASDYTKDRKWTCLKVATCPIHDPIYDAQPYIPDDIIINPVDVKALIEKGVLSEQTLAAQLSKQIIKGIQGL